jgi:hypothetical protein
MVEDSAKAGQLIICPNCRQTLRVPSGKERGKEIKAPPPAVSAQPTRPCHRCGEGVPLQAQICPHCNAIQLDAPAGAGVPAAARRPPALAVRFGGSRSTWWNQLSPGARGGLVAGIVGFALVAIAIFFFVLGPMTSRRETEQGRIVATRALAQGRQLESEGRFQDAYDKYHEGLVREKYLLASPAKTDRDMARALRERAMALRYIVPTPRTNEPLRWRPQSAEERDEAESRIRAAYPVYRQRILAITGAGLEAVRVARSSSNRQAYAAKVTDVLSAFVAMMGETTREQRALWSLEMLTQALAELGSANRDWDTGRERWLTTAQTRLEALEARVRQPPITPQGDVLRE